MSALVDEIMSTALSGIAPSENAFPLLEVSGAPRERGRAHGEHFAERIRTTFDFYMHDLFSGSPLSADQIEARARGIEPIGQRYAPAITQEIRGIAEGSGLEPWQIFALNARTEILNARIDECSALYFADSAILGQNWDWVEPLEPLCILIRHRHEDGFERLVFSEPGMVAKIGMNSAGLGICLNILFAPHDLSGLPVHMLIGALLDCRDFESGRDLLENCGRGKASHLLLANGEGSAVSAEFYGDDLHLLSPQDGLLLHTNHCVALGEAGRLPDLANSCARFDRLVQKTTASERDLATAKSILLSVDGGEDSIMREYRPQSFLGTHRVGSCASVLMELDRGRLHIKRGPGAEDDYQSIDLSQAA